MENEKTAPKSRKRQFNPGNLFWGLLLAFIGTAFLLDEFNIIDFQFSNLWRLWPLLIIAAGVSILALKGWVGVMTTSLLMVLMFGIIALASFGYMRPDTSATATTKTIAVARSGDNVETVNLAITGGAGEIDIRSADQEQLLKASLESNFTNLKQDSNLRDGTQYISLSFESSRNWMHSSFTNNLDVTLTESVLADLKVEAGASKINGDLTNVQLRSLDIDSGASEAKFKLGGRTETTDVAIDMGMSSITLVLPKSSGVSVRLDSGMSSKSLPGLHEVSRGHYESDNFAAAEHKINIRGNIGMTSLKLEYY